MEKNRCFWCKLNNPLYVKYHDNEWGVPTHDDKKLFELLTLEAFQAGLSWECVLNKREAFRSAFDNFNIDKICSYDDIKISALMENKNIIRNRLKISATIKNAIVFKLLQNEFGSFNSYIWSFTNGQTIYENDKTHSPLSDQISKDLKDRGMNFVGTTIIYSFLQAIGIINSHMEDCFLFHKK